MKENDPRHPAQADLRLPPSFASRYDVVAAIEANPYRAMAAALGLCWHGRGRITGAKWSGGKVLDYGGAVIDELLGRGVTYADVALAGSRALDLIVQSLPQAGEVKEAEGNSEAQEESLNG
tara:strand:- start:84 stop:446 length:363 start_codon:yes stop_codon:yes gene_type:complete